MSGFRGVLDDGIFPVTPGIPMYNIGSPVFENISIKLPNGKESSPWWLKTVPHQTSISRKLS